MCLATQRRFSGIERAERKCEVTKDSGRLLALFVASGHNGEREDTALSSQSLPQGLGGGDTKKQNWGEVREVSGEVPPHLRDLNDQEPDVESSRRKADQVSTLTARALGSVPPGQQSGCPREVCPDSQR